MAKPLMRGVKNRLHPLYVVWISVMWVLLMGELSWANVLAGVGVGLVVTMALPLPSMPTSGLHISWPRLVWFMFVWAWDLWVAACKVAWLAVRRTAPPKTAIVELPLRVDSEFVLALGVIMYNLQPGGAVTDISIANRTLTIHLLDADNEEAIAREAALVAKLERNLIDIFERNVRP